MMIVSIVSDLVIDGSFLFFGFFPGHPAFLPLKAFPHARYSEGNSLSEHCVSFTCVLHWSNIHFLPLGFHCLL